MDTRRKWNDLTPAQQRALIAVGAVEVVLTGIALRDLAGRSASEVHGRKWAWALALTVQPFGPIAYLLRGRRRIS